MLQNQPNSPLTVSQLNRQVKQLLETQYPAVPVQGEISTLSRPASGHIYFTLKDSNGQIRCAMFKGQLTRNKYIPKQGDEVIVTGRVSLYEGRGDYQLIATSIKPVGEGALQAAFFQMKDRLATEGLFEEQHKQVIPNNIKTVGVVTSSTGAAFHDILTVLNRRFPAINVILYPSQVQGNEATATVVEAINTANNRNEVDILIVGRGGGSLEDLWCFNTEPVARAIYNSNLPIISAVGHEVDVSISDFVADVRAATPSQAAEMISPDQFELTQTIDNHEQRLMLAISHILKHKNQQIDSLVKRIKSPVETVSDWNNQLTNLVNRLNLAASRPLTLHRQKLDHLKQRLILLSPQNKVETDRISIDKLEQRLKLAINNSIDPKKSLFAQLVGKLNVLSPLATLDRGYSITRNTQTQVIQTSENIQIGDELETLLQDGKLYSVVTKTEK